MKPGGKISLGAQRGVRRARALQRRDQRLNIISARLKLARRQHDPPWTLEQLSAAVEEREGLEISLGTIGKIEAGVRGVYDYEVAAFANVLGISADWLLGRTEAGHQEHLPSP